MRALNENWEQLRPPLTIGREAERAALLEALKRSGSVVEVVAAAGMGKTTLIKRVALDMEKVSAGTTEYFVGGYPLSEAVDVIAESLRKVDGHSLLVIDEADRLDPRETYEAINRLSIGPWSFSTLIASRFGVGLGEPVIRLSPLPNEVFQAVLGSLFDGKLDAAGMDRLWEATHGNPLLARLLSEQWRGGKARDVAALVDLLSPWRSWGLVGPSGLPLQHGGAAEQRIVTDVREISDALLREIANNPLAPYELSPRRFEELVAELLQRAGYQVTLTPQTRDGGKDMYAARSDQLGSFLYVVECKRHAPDRPVGVGVVRSLHGVAQLERATAAMVITTSYFTRPAREFADELKFQIALNDYFDLRHWLKQYSCR